MANVYFKEGTQSDYESIIPDEHTFYRIVDDSNNLLSVYFGSLRLDIDDDIITNRIDELKERISKLEQEESSFINGEEIQW